MLKPKTTLLTAIRNTTAQELLGIPAGASKVIFANLEWVYAYRYFLATELSQGHFEATDIRGNILTPPLAGGAAGELVAEVSNYYTMLGFPTFPHYDKAVRLHWNLSAVHSVMDVIGADILVEGLEALELTKEDVIQKLQPGLDYMRLGMFLEAAALVRAITPDAFLTSARLELYATILESANAL